MVKVHIGNKVKEVLRKERIPVAKLAEKIHLTRDAAYKMLKKETIPMDQLRKIGAITGHDFFQYYRDQSTVDDTPPPYGYATTNDVALVSAKVDLIMEKMVALQKSIEMLAAKQTRKKK
ncbi:MAG TPA: hypothetical protein VD905_18975 [Flavobacteriales bacterium]|nr:hypothetical protein [Flavobacteriales bacterium]